MHIAWYAGHCRIIDLDLHYNAMYWGKLRLNIWLTILRFIPNLIIRCTIYEVEFILIMCPIYMWPSNVIQLQPGQEISVEFCRTVRKSFLQNSVEFPKRIGTIFPYISTEFPHISTERKFFMEMYGNQRGKHLCTEMCGIVRKSVKKNSVLPEMCGNQIWLRSGLNWLFNLILTAVKMQKKTIVKSC